jgi:hypothetical protein
VYFQVNLAFLCVQYGILAVAVLLLVVCTYAYVCTAPALPRRRPLKHAWLHPLFALLTFGANLTMLVSKEIVADTAVKVGTQTQASRPVPQGGGHKKQKQKLLDLSHRYMRPQC